MRSDHLYVAITAGKPIGGARWSLDGIERVEVGRGSAREATRTGTTLRVELPDPWMSTSHVRFERERKQWVAVDAGSRNGILISGDKHASALLTDRDVVEAGRSFMIVRTSELASSDLDIAHPEPRTLMTLDPTLAFGYAELGEVASSRAPILLGGAPGSGKERVARAVHDWSGRSAAFVAVRADEVGDGSDRELFGTRGTVFVEDFQALPGPSCEALLHTLGERDVRLIGATRHDLDAVIDPDPVRRQLCAHHAGFELALPSLTDRLVDLGLLMTELVPPSTQLAGVAARVLLAYHWPENVRELARVLDRAVTIACGSEIGLAYLPEEIAAARFTKPVTELAVTRRNQLAALLNQHDGNAMAVAHAIGRELWQVERWLVRYGLASR